jgi:diaminopimelate decarboxylase
MRRMSDPNRPEELHASAEPTLASALVARLFGQREGVLLVDDHPVTELVEAFGTPLYVYSQRVLDQTWQTLRAAFPAAFDIYYSIKANPHPDFLAYFLRHGCGLEIASGGELTRALRAGCDPRRILYAGPGKTTEELRMAIEAGIGEIHAESPGEVARIEQVAAAAERTVGVALRVNPAPQGAGGAMLMGGRATPFGVDEEQLPDVLALARSCPHIDLVGLHMNTGTQWLDAVTLADLYRQGWRIAAGLHAAFPQGLRTLDFGGGLGIPYFAGEQPLDFARLGVELSSLVEEVETGPVRPCPRLMIEPGRYLVGESGLYVTRVVDVKQSRGQTFVVLDGGMHHHAAATGNFGQTLRRPFPLATLNRLNAPCDQRVTLVGPLCTPLDTFARNLAWPEPRVGDLVGVFQSGAYARAASPLQFLGHRTPAETWVSAREARLIQPRGAWA